MKCKTCQIENLPGSLQCARCGRPLRNSSYKSILDNDAKLKDVQITRGSSLPKPHVVKPKKKYFIIFLCIAAVFVLSSLLVYGVIMSSSRSNSKREEFHPQFFVKTHGIGQYEAPNHDMIGLSDGSIIFDIGPGRKNVQTKLKAVEAYKSGDRSTALSLWGEAVREDPSDAEAHIFLENLRIELSQRKYITLVIAVPLAPVPDYSSRSYLQGAFIAQQERNQSSNSVSELHARFFIAKSGTKPEYVPWIAEQIALAAKDDPTIVGVIGWPDTARAGNAIYPLSKAKIPMVSSVAAGDSLTGISDYFFRVVPPNRTLAQIAAKYVKTKLQRHRVALFTDTGNDFSRTISKDFEEEFSATDYNIVAYENFKVGEQKSFEQHLTHALVANPDLIFFTTSEPTDVQKFLALLPTSGPFSHLEVLTGSAGVTLVNYDNNQRIGFPRLHMISLSYPDMWTIVGKANKKPPFFDEYKKTYYDSNSHNTYGSIRADTQAILTYDATSTLLFACQVALVVDKEINPSKLPQFLLKIKGSQSLQGASGVIEFDNDHNPVRKVIVIISVRNDYTTYLDTIEGCLVKDAC